MPSNKDRLYVALYARAGRPTMPGLEDTYHWGLIVGPKVEPEGGRGYRFHAKEKLAVLSPDQPPQSVWEFEEREVSLMPTSMLLVRLVIGKITNMEVLRAILRNTPIRAGQLGYEKWNCVGWVQEALENLQRDGKALGTSITDWKSIRDKAMLYVQEKKDSHRFDGKGSFNQRKAATWDMLTGAELIP